MKLLHKIIIISSWTYSRSSYLNMPPCVKILPNIIYILQQKKNEEKNRICFTPWSNLLFFDFYSIFYKFVFFFSVNASTIFVAVLFFFVCVSASKLSSSLCVCKEEINNLWSRWEKIIYYLVIVSGRLHWCVPNQNNNNNKNPSQCVQSVIFNIFKIVSK